MPRAPCRHGVARPDADLASPFVANHASRVGPADACFRDCIGAAWQPLTVAPMLRPRRAMCVRRRLLPVIRAKVGKHWIARPRLMLCLWKQRCCTSTPTSSCTDSRTAPAMQRPRARRRDEWSSSDPRASNALTERSQAVALRRSISLDAAAETLGLSAHSRHRVGRRRRYSPVVRCERVVGQRAGYRNAVAERHSDGRASRSPSLVMKLQAAAWRAASTAPVSSRSRWAPSI